MGKNKHQKQAEISATGIVLTRTRNGVIVKWDGDEPADCRVPGKGKSFGMPVPGDHIRFTPPTKTKDGWVQEILPRSSLLNRYVYGRIKEIAANMEQVLILATPDEPVVSPRLVDRMLVGCSVGNMDATILLNKADLFTDDQLDAYSEPWRQAGYKVIKVSAKTGTNIDLVEAQLTGRISLLSGPSGVGKSTLMNRLIADLDLDTSALSTNTGRGVHTTTYTRLFPFPSGGTVADSPGIREFHPVVETDELAQHFVEFRKFSPDCEFRNCLHFDDEGCAVNRAVEAGLIHPDRYESYRILHASLLEGPRRGRQNLVTP